MDEILWPVGVAQRVNGRVDPPITQFRSSTHVTRGGPSLWFQRVPEGKTVKNRQHFDLCAMGPLDDEVQRLVALGARVVSTGRDLVVMADVEGNEFCVEP